MKRLTMFLPAVAIAASLIAGCGGGEDDDLSKAEFVEQAVQACLANKSTLDEYNAWGEQNGAPNQSPAELRTTTFENVQLPAIEAELAAVRDLGLPEDDAAGAREFIVAQQNAIDTAVRADDGKSRAEMMRSFDAAAKLAKAYGIEDCGSPIAVLIGA